MKRLKKTILIILIGILLMLIGYAFGARFYDFKNMNSDIFRNKIHKSYNYYEDESTKKNIVINKKIDLNGVKNIYIKSKVGELNVIGNANTDDLNYFTENVNENYFSVEKNGDNIIIKDETPSKNFLIMNLKKAKYDKIKIKIEIPTNLFNEINIEAGVGLTNLQNLNTKNFILKTGAGEVNIDKLKINQALKAEAGMGEVNIKDSHIHDMQIKTGVGKFNFSGNISGDTELEAGIGECNFIIYGDINDYDIQVKSGIGEVSINGTTYLNGTTYFQNMSKPSGTPNAKSLKLIGGIGEISVKFRKE